MKILLSAYACEPHKGSEPEVGWQWATKLAAGGHEVTVLTRENNRSMIEGVARKPESRLEFVYYDLPWPLPALKKRLKLIHLYYYLWQIGLFLKVRKELPIDKFEVVHHITFVSIRQPSFLGNLGLPFWFGPAAGGDIAPRKLRKSFPLRGKLHSYARDFANLLVTMDPFVKQNLRKAQKVVVTSDQTFELLPQFAKSKTTVALAVGIDETNIVQTRPKTQLSRMLFVGNLLYLKGIHIALSVLSILVTRQPHLTLTIAGSGKEEKWLKDLAAKLRLGNAISWVGHISHQQINELYDRHDFLLFPSLQDSGGFAVLEALSRGLPVGCLALGGPGQIVDHSCGVIVDPAEKSEDQVVTELADGISQLVSDPHYYEQLATNATKRARQFTWQKTVTKVYGS